MPYTTITSGTTITAAWANANVRDQVITPFAGTSARTSAITLPLEGMATYDTTNNNFEIYTTSATGWRAPWNLPWGRISHATSATAMGAGSIGTTDTDITGITVTVTTVANRYYKITGTCTFDGASNNCDVFLKILQGASVQDSTMGYLSTTTPSRLGLPITTIVSPGSGSFTFKLQASTSAGTIRGIGGGATATAKIIVEDIGPNGGPA
jgi:hypothetical protein